MTQPYLYFSRSVVGVASCGVLASILVNRFRDSRVAADFASLNILHRHQSAYVKLSYEERTFAAVPVRFIRQGNRDARNCARAKLTTLPAALLENQSAVVFVALILGPIPSLIALWL